MDQKLTEYFQRFPIRDLDRYDLSEAVYVNSGTKFKGTCPEHGEFLLVPSRIKKLSEDGLTLCARCNKQNHAKSMATQQGSFAERAAEVHGGKYDYSKVEYVNAKTKVTIICPVHGEFSTLPSNHLSMGSGCPECGRDRTNAALASVRVGTEEFVRRAKLIFGDTYSYDKVEYTSNKDKVTVTCPTHGDFQVTPSNHLTAKSGCPTCGLIRAHAKH